MTEHNKVSNRAKQLNEFTGNLPDAKPSPASTPLKPKSAIKPFVKPKPKTTPEKVGDSFRTGANKVPTALKLIPGLGQAVSAGAGIGQAMKDNLPRNTAGSGRGSGRTAFTDTPKPKPVVTPKIKPKPQPEPQPEKQTEPDASTIATKDKDKTTTTTTTGTDTVKDNKTKTDTAKDTKTDTTQDTKTDTLGDKAKRLAAGAAALGIGALTKSKMGKIGKTSGHVRVNPREEEQKEDIEVVCDFLLNEGYASTGTQAENIYDHMSDEWKDYILKGE